jgi:hypothetical protein
MTVEEAIYTFLVDQAWVTDESMIVAEHPDEDSPSLCLAVTVINDGHDSMMLGEGTGFADCEVQFDAYGNDVGEVAELIDNLRESLQGYVGSMGEREVCYAEYLNGGALPVGSPKDGSDRWKKRKMAEYLIVFEV